MTLTKAKFEFNVATVDDLRFIIYNEKEILQSWLVLGKYYEKDMIEFIKDNYNGGTFIDVGACIGTHTLPFSKLADEVYSFEPSNRFLTLLMNLELNKIKNVNTYNIALGNQEGVLKFYTDNQSASGGNIDINGTEQVLVTKLDNFDIKNIVLIKIDVEGFELEVLKGAERLIRENKPDMYIECATKEIYESVCDFVNKLECEYGILNNIFNNTPTFLFTTRQVEKLNGEKHD